MERGDPHCLVSTRVWVLRGSRLDRAAFYRYPVIQVQVIGFISFLLSGTKRWKRADFYKFEHAKARPIAKEQKERPGGGVSYILFEEIQK